MMENIFSFRVTFNALDFILLFISIVCLLRAFVPEKSFEWEDSIKYEELYFTSACGIIGTLLFCIAVFAV